MRWRVYKDVSNTDQTWWCVDNGDCWGAMKVRWVQFLSKSFTSSHFPGENVQDRNEPISWVETSAIAKFENGGIIFSDEVHK